VIPRSVIDEVVRRSDIVQVIGMYVQLKRAGSNWNGLCPFHSEKSPSFTVFPGTDSFYCFGCGAGGDVITFIKKSENLDYVDAVRLLADRAGIEVPDDAGNENRGPSRERIKLMNVAAAKIFHSCLLNDAAAEPARQYLKKREIADATVRHFYLGYAPADFSWLYPRLHAQGFTDEEMTAGFLCGNSNGRVYDYFRGRVIYPIVDTSKNVVAFGGRVLDDSKPKYLNTSDTPAFKKSRNLFALNYARDYCQDYLILCEGYMDVISMHQAGFQNAVATLGTAITEEHARIIAKYTKKVILSYDSDGAGQNATDKAMKLLDGVGVPVRILKMEGAKDPDEYIKKFGKEKFRALIEGSRTGFEFRLESVLSKFPQNDDQNRLRAASELADIISGYGSAVERDLYSSKAASALGIAVEPLREDIEKYRRRRIRQMNNEAGKEAVEVLRNFNDRINPDAARNVRAASAEEAVLGLLLLYPEHRDSVLRGDVKLESEDFFTLLGRKAFDSIMSLHADTEGFSFSLLGEFFTDDEMGRLKSYEVNRTKLSSNGREALLSAARILHEERVKKEQSEPGKNAPSLSDSLLEKRRKLQQKKDGGH